MRNTRHEKPCVDCRHYRYSYTSSFYNCQSINTGYPDVVDGTINKSFQEIREDKENCGPDGIYWEEMPPPTWEPKPTLWEKHRGRAVWLMLILVFSAIALQVFG